MPRSPLRRRARAKASSRRAPQQQIAALEEGVGRLQNALADLSAAHAAVGETTEEPQFNAMAIFESLPPQIQGEVRQLAQNLHQQGQSMQRALENAILETLQQYPEYVSVRLDASGAPQPVPELTAARAAIAAALAELDAGVGEAHEAMDDPAQDSSALRRANNHMAEAYRILSQTQIPEREMHPPPFAGQGHRLGEP